MNLKELSRQHDELVSTGVLYHEGKEQAEEEIEKLSQFRQEISDKLNTAWEAMKTMLGGEANVDDLFGQIKSNTFDSLEQSAVELWLKHQKSQLPLNLSKVRLALKIPKEVKDFVEAASEAYEISVDATKYWDAARKSFKPVPVSKEEKEHIRRRCKVYARSQKHIGMYETLRPIVDLINLVNKGFHGSYWEGSANEITWLGRFIERKVTKDSAGMVVKDNVFFFPRFKYSAFDEDYATPMIPMGNYQKVA